MAASTRLTPEQRTMRARIAANTRWSRESGKTNAERAQRGLRARFEREVDPDGTLPPDERERRAERAFRAHMQRLALKSSKARAARKTASNERGTSPTQAAELVPPDQLGTELMIAVEVAADVAVGENQSVVLAGVRDGKAVVVDDTDVNRRLPGALVVLPDVDVLAGQAGGGQLPPGAVHLTASDGRGIVVCGYDPATLEGGGDAS